MVNVSQQIARLRDRGDDDAARIELESQALGEKGAHRDQSFACFAPAPDEQKEVVHIAEVMPHSQILLHEVVEGIQINVREELAR